MRKIVYGSEKPLAIEKKPHGDGRATVYVRTNIEHRTVSDEIYEREEWSWIEYNAEIQDAFEPTEEFAEKVIIAEQNKHADATLRDRIADLEDAVIELAEIIGGE